MRSNADLIEAAVQGDGSAFAILVERYERLVWTICWHCVRDYHATQDLTQEVFLLAHSRLKTLRKPDSFGSWIAAIARREARRSREQDARSISVDPNEIRERTGVQESVNELQTHERLIEAVAELPEHERVVTVLRYLNGHSVAEVAGLTCRPIGTVTKQLSRALERLKSKLNRLESPLRVKEEGDVAI